MNVEVAFSLTPIDGKWSLCMKVGEGLLWSVKQYATDPDRDEVRKDVDLAMRGVSVWRNRNKPVEYIKRVDNF